MKNIVIVGLFLWLWYTIHQVDLLTERVWGLEQLTVGLQEEGQKL